MLKNKLFAIYKPALQNILSILHKSEMPHEDLLAPNYTSNYEVANNTAIIRIEGPIYRYESLWCRLTGGISFERLFYDLQMAFNDDRVSDILFYINSPGGEVDGMFEFSSMIRNSPKPTRSYISGTGASAAYLIASSTGAIIANESALVGSIGIITVIEDYSKAMELEGIQEYVFTSSVSPLKHTDVKTQEGQSVIQATIDELGKLFVDKVAMYRNETAENIIANFGGGDVLLAGIAETRGMIDAIGNLDYVLINKNIEKRSNAIMGNKVPLKAMTDEKKAVDPMPPEEEEKPVNKEEMPVEVEVEVTEDETEEAMDKKMAAILQNERKRVAKFDLLLGAYPSHKQAILKMRDSGIQAEQASFAILKLTAEAKEALKNGLNEDANEIPNLQASAGAVSNEDKTIAELKAAAKGVRKYGKS